MAAIFDGSASYFDFTLPSDCLDQGTLLVWVKPSSHASYKGVVGSSTPQYYFYMYTTPAERSDYGFGNTGASAITDGIDASGTVWTPVVFRWDKNASPKVLIDINGSQVSTSNGAWTGTDTAWTLGTLAANYFVGKMAVFGLANTALSDANARKFDTSKWIPSLIPGVTIKAEYIFNNSGTGTGVTLTDHSTSITYDTDLPSDLVTSLGTPTPAAYFNNMRNYGVTL